MEIVPQKRCPNCGQTLLATSEFFHRDTQKPSGLSSWCAECSNERNRARQAAKPEEVRESKRRHDRKMRLQALVAYSADPPFCACCGEWRLPFLAIDHINGGGKQHRLEVGNNSSAMVYRWLRNNDYPPGFQVLCHNCNLAKGFYGRCPHEDER